MYASGMELWMDKDRQFIYLMPSDIADQMEDTIRVVRRHQSLLGGNHHYIAAINNKVKVTSSKMIIPSERSCHNKI